MATALRALQIGQYPKALEIFQGIARDRAIPKQIRADAHTNAAVCLIRLRRWEDAEHCAQAATDLDPGHVDAWFNLGGIRMQLGKTLDALMAFRRCVSLRPSRLDALRYRANLAAQYQLWSEAADAYAVLARSYPQDRSLWSRWIEAMVLAGKAPLLDELTRKALDQNPQDALLRVARLRVLVDLERFGEASALLSSLEDIPSELAAWVFTQCGDTGNALMLRDSVPKRARYHVLGLLVPGWSEDPLAAAVEYTRNPDPTDSARDLAGLHFSLARTFEDHGEIPTAMGHYAAAHSILSRQEPFSWDGHRTLHRWLVDERPWRRLAPAKASGGARWIFVVGMPRSGTSLLEQVLDSHPAFLGLGERHEIAMAMQRYFSDRDGKAMESAFWNLQRQAEAAQGHRWIIDKMPANFQYVGAILDLLPDAQVIWCLRDPLDNGLSIWRQHFRGQHPYAHDLHTLGRYYRWHEAMLALTQERYGDRLHVVRYESLVEHFQGTVGTLLAHLGEPWDPRCERFYENPRKVRTASRDQVRRPLYQDAIGVARGRLEYLRELQSGLDAGCNDVLA